MRKRGAQQLSFPGMKAEPMLGPPAPEPGEAHHLRNIAATAPMRTLTDMAGVEGITSEGQFKTQRELGRGGPGASFAPRLRKESEEVMYGEGAHPVYGYFSHGDERDMLQHTGGSDTPQRYDDVAVYGHTAFELKESMRKHTTYSWGDTLGAYRGEASPVAKQGNLIPKLEGDLANKMPGEGTKVYTEMHVHDRPGENGEPQRLSLNDVSKAIVYEGSQPIHRYGSSTSMDERTSRTEEMLRGANVAHEVRHVGLGGQQVLPFAHEDWGDAHWTKVGSEDPGKEITDKEGWAPGKYAYDTPRDEQRPMVTTKRQWKPE